jgi:hypothetical protein
MAKTRSGIAPMRPSSPDLRRRLLAQLLLCAPVGLPLLSACGSGSSPTPVPAPPPPPLPPGPPVFGPAWSGYARDAQHSALGAIASQPFNQIRWFTPVDLAPQYSGSSLWIHYGSPVISARNAVIVPVKTGATGGFRLEARLGSNGILLWSADSDYVLPAHDWVPSFGACITASNRMYAPRSGGRLMFRDDVDNTSGTIQTAVFYGAASYAAAPATYDDTIRISTPLTADAAGNLFFGFVATGANPSGLMSGIARLAADGTGTWVGATLAAASATITQVALNCAPALSLDGGTLYVAVNTSPLTGVRQTGFLLALDSATLATVAKIALTDPLSGTPAWVNDNATSSPTIGPDGDVYFGVLEANLPAHNDRGWLLHFDATLSVSKTPGSFGWDDTVSIVPAPMIPSYAGPSTYLLGTKYNNYAGLGTGDGRNRIAVLDPNQTQIDTIAGIPVMKEILTQLGPTAEGGAGAVKEWCINTAAVDPLTNSMLVNSEDGRLYRWDLPTNQFVESIALTSGVGEAYTPTVLGPDGAVYAINNAVLFSVGR